MASAPHRPSAISNQTNYVYTSMPHYTNNNNNNNNSNNNNTYHRHISKTLAHSTSMLANETYMAGMSSDSELTSTTRHHYRPYSSQSRVYHAHPAPRGSQPSSRMSHYSDSVATYASHSQPVSSSIISQSQQHMSQQQSSPLPGVVSLAGTANQPPPGHYMVGYEPSAMLSQQGNLSRPASGRQLPQRPFKQSMSIDHHSLSSQYAHKRSPSMSSPLSMSSRFADKSDAHSPHQPNYMTGSHQSLVQCINPIAEQNLSLESRYGQQSRNYRVEMDLLEKQAAGINIYDNDHTGLATAHSSPRAPSSRQLTPATSAGISSSPVSEQLHRQLDQYNRPTDSQQNQHQQHHNKHHQQDLYASHQMTSTPGDWLPPLGITGAHHLGGRTNQPQFKQTMSIDHHPVASQHYSSQRAHFSEQYYGSLGYSTSYNESPTHHQQLAVYPTSGDQHNDISHPYASAQDHHLFSSPATAGRNLQDLHQQQDPHQAPNFNNQPRGSAKKLQHQASSSSSNSPSGSLQSNKSLIDQQKAVSLYQYQQHHSSPQNKASQEQQQHKHVAMKEGYTSMASNLVNPNPAFNESVNFLSSQLSTPTGGGVVAASAAHLGSRSGLKRSAIRSASPAQETTSSCGQYNQGPNSSKNIPSEVGTRSESSTGLPISSSDASHLTKKSNSATQLSMSGTKKRLGFRKKQVTSFSVHRSEEVAPLEARHLVKQGSSVSDGDSSMSGDSSSRSWSNSNFKQQTSEELASMSFIEGLGKGQMISRQGLASPYLGDIQLSLCDRRGNLEVEVIKARNLQAKTNKILPLTYVKLYLVKNRKCLAKAKTTLSNKRTLNPLFQQQLTFHDDYHGSILQSIIWGNFGKMDKKNFMGIAQISIDDLELSDTVVSWYKLFLPSSLQTLPSKSLRHTLLSNSTESFTNTNNS